MAKRRIINTRFWSDSWISNLDPSEKLLFIYLLTNEHTDICGIYELPLRKMAFETGIDKEMVEMIMKRFETDKKVFYFSGWVYIRNFIKYQEVNPQVEIGIKRSLSEVPREVLEAINRLPIESEILKLKPKPKLKPEPKLKLKVMVASATKELVNYYYELKGWGNKDKSFYKENEIVYGRAAKPAKQLLELCEGNLEEAKLCLSKVKEWAESRGLDWSIETIFKRWYDIDLLKPKEKKPYFEGKRIFQKVEGGKWYSITPEGIKELGIWPKKEQLVWK